MSEGDRNSRRFLIRPPEALVQEALELAQDTPCVLLLLFLGSEEKDAHPPMIYLFLRFSSFTVPTSQFFYLFLLVSSFSVLGYPLCRIDVRNTLESVKKGVKTKSTNELKG